MKSKSPFALCHIPNNSSSSVLALALVALLTSPAHSAPRVWSGTTSTSWSVGGAGGNWTNLSAPVAGDTLTFAGTVNTATVNDLAADTSFGSLSFTNTLNAQSFNLSGNRITLGGNITTTTTSTTGTNNITDTIALDMILSGNRTITAATRHNLTVTGILSEDATPRSLNKIGAATLTLQGANTFSGSAQVYEAALNLSGANGSMLNSSGVIVSGGTFSLANTSIANNTNRLPDAGTVTMSGGTFSFGITTTAGSYSETTGELSISTGANTITSGQALAGQTSGLTFASLTRTASTTVNFSGTGLGADTRNQTLFTANPTLANGIIGAWATTNNADWASYDATNGVTALAPASYANDTWAAGNNTTVTTSTAPTAASETHTLRFNLAAADTVNLNGTNTITGGILVTAGVGANVSTITGGTLQGSPGGELFVHQHNGTVGGGLTIGSILQDNTTATSLVKTGGSALTLTASNTYTGGTVVNAGAVVLINAGPGETLQGPITLRGTGRIVLGKSNQIPDTSVITFGSGGNSSRFQLSNAAGVGYNETIGGINDAAGTFVGNRIVESANDAFNDSPGTLTINTATGQTYTFGGFVRNAAGGATNSPLSIVKDGLGTQEFSGAPATVNYSGGTTVNAGILRLSGASSFLGTTAVTLNGGFIEFAGTGTYTRAAALGGTNGGVIKSGTGILTLSGANTYGGPTLINGGTLNAGIADGAGSGALGNGGDITFGGGTLQYSAASAGTDYATRIKNSANAIRLDTNAQTVTLAGAIGSTNTSGLTKSGTGTLILSGNNAYTGSTTITDGTLQLNRAGGTIPDAGSVSLNTTDTAVLDVAQSDTIANLNLSLATTVSGAGTLTVTTAITPNIAINKINTISASLAGTAQLKKTGQGTTILSAVNSYSGGTWLNGTNSKLTISGSGTLGSTSGTLLIDTLGAVLDLGTTSQTVGAVTLTEGTIQNGTLTGGSYSIAAGTVNAVLAGPGIALTKTTAGTATLSGINTYTGDTTVSEGVLAINGTAIADGNKLVIAGGLVDLTGAETVGTLFFGATQQAAGTYSSDGAGGTIASANFTGTGTLVVTTGPAAGGYASWMAPFITGGLTGDTTGTGDPDKDGMQNQLEYALNGNPSISDSSILPDLVVTATDFEFTYSRLDLSLSDTVQTFEYGNNLTGWTPIVIPAASGTVGIATITITDAGSTDTVKVSIPKTAAASGKLFGRLQVVK